MRACVCMRVHACACVFMRVLAHMCARAIVCAHAFACLKASRSITHACVHRALCINPPTDTQRMRLPSPHMHPLAARNCVAYLVMRIAIVHALHIRIRTPSCILKISLRARKHFNIPDHPSHQNRARTRPPSLDCACPTAPRRYGAPYAVRVRVRL